MNLVGITMAGIVVLSVVSHVLGNAFAVAIPRAEEYIQSFDDVNRVLLQWWILAGGGFIFALWMSSNYLLPRTAPNIAFPLFAVVLIFLPVGTICASVLAVNSREGSIEG